MAGHDLSVQGVAGLINVPLGQEAQAIMPWLPLADIASAMFAAISVLSALLTRSRSGQGSTVDVSMLDSLVSWMAPFIVPAINGMMPAPLPPKDPGYGLFGTADDRQITLSIAGEDHMWNALCVLLGLDDLAALTEAQRVERAAEVGPILRRAVASRPLAWLVQQLELRQIAFGPVLSLAEVADGAQVVHRGMIASVPGTNGAIRHVLQPLAIKGLQTPIRCNAPRLGEHTNELLRECRYDPAATIRLAAVATAAADGASAPA